MDVGSERRAPAASRALVGGALTTAALLTSLGYLVWRATATGAGAQPVLWWALLLAEAFGVVRLTTELVLAGAAPPPPSPPSPSLGDVDVDIVVVVDDEHLAVVRAALLAAASVEGARSVSVLDSAHRREVLTMARRVGATPDPGDPTAPLAARATAWLQGCTAPSVLIVAGDTAVLPHAARLLDAHLTGSTSAATGTVEEVNATHRVHRSGLGDADVWRARVIPRLSRAGALVDWGGVVLVRRADVVAIGGFRSADGARLSATAPALHHAGHRTAAARSVVAHRLAPGVGLAARHRYCRELHGRLRRLAPGRVPLRGLAALSTWSAVLSPLRALQRLVLVAVAVATLLSSRPPLVASGALWLAWWSTRQLLAGLARVAAARPARPTVALVHDLRLMTCDLAVGVGALRPGWRPARGGGRPPGDGALRHLPRAVQAIAGCTLFLVLTGFVHVRVGDLTALVAIVGLLVHMGASWAARRSMARRQFRSSYRTDQELPVLDSVGVRVVGMSPLGFDLLSTDVIPVGTPVRVTVALPQARGTSTPTELCGVVRRSGAVAGGGAAYVPFTTLDDETGDRVHVYLAVGSFLADARQDEEVATGSAP